MLHGSEAGPLTSRISAARSTPWTSIRTVLLVLRVVVLVAVVVDVPMYPSSAAERYIQIAHEPGVPYRDFEVEYPPGELLFALLAGAGGLGTARALLAVVAFTGDVATFLLLRRSWSARIADRYLLLGTPLLIFIYRRIDLAAVALAVAAIALVRRGRSTSGGITLASAVLTRAWPIALVPLLFVQRSLRAAAGAAIAAAVGVSVWIAVGGGHGVRETFTSRGATGWELESFVGVIVWALTSDHRFEAGANRAGVIPGWFGPVAAIGLVAVSIAIWIRAGRFRDELDPAGAPSVAAIASLLVFAPILSPQYASWLLPWAAIAGEENRAWTGAVAVPVILTAALVSGWFLDLALGPGRDQLLIFSRNLSLVAVVGMYFFTTRAGYPVAPERPTVADPRSGS